MTTSRAHTWAIAVLIWAALVSTARIEAHEIGTTRVDAVFDRANQYRIEIVTDAASLVEKLDVMSGRTRQTSADAVELLRRLRASDATFRRRAHVDFDAASEPPAIEYAVSEAAGLVPPVAIVTLCGHAPAGASRFTWTYGWTFASYALTVRCDGCTTAATEWLDGGGASRVRALKVVAPAPTRVAVAGRYLALGFTHIVPYGFDHVLFVLGIFLLSRRPRQILVQVSAFTLAHSISLALSSYGIVSAPPRVVEPMIAVSIAYVAIENLLSSDVKPWRVALVFAFGLLHGLGFAGALKELGLPRAEFVTALVTFNLGVEGGQLAVIAAAFLLVGWRWGSRDWYRPRIVIPASFAIACTALYWTVVRLA